MNRNVCYFKELYIQKEKKMCAIAENHVNKNTQTYNSTVRSNEPVNWIKKQTTYYFREKSPQTIIQNTAQPQISFYKPMYENSTMKSNQIIQGESYKQSSYLQLNQQNKNSMPIIRIPPQKSTRVIKLMSAQFIENHNVTMKPHSPSISCNNYNCDNLDNRLIFR